MCESTALSILHKEADFTFVRHTDFTFSNLLTRLEAKSNVVLFVLKSFSLLFGCSLFHIC